MLTVEPCGGLGNRLRALDSALSLGRKIDMPLHLIWRKNKELNCNFSTLFYIPDAIKKLSQPYTPLRIKRIFKKLNLYRFRYQKTFFQNDIETLVGRKYKFENLREFNSIYISTLTRFFNNSHPYSDFVPKPKIQNAVNDVTRKFNSSTIGVHIRRTDNLKSKSVSKIKKFEKQMNSEIVLNPYVTFFLATDDPGAEEYFSEKFNDKIIIYPKREIKRSKPVAIEDALIDLLCLSQTRKILGSYWSSFTDTASQIKNIEVLIVK